MISTHQHLVSRVFSKNILRDMQNHAFKILESTGLYENEEERQVKDEFLPWLLKEVKSNLVKNTNVESFLKSILILFRNHINHQ